MREEVADNGDHAALAIQHRRARGTVIEDQTVVSVVHLEQRRTCDPVAISVSHEATGGETQTIAGIGQTDDALFCGQWLRPDLQGLCTGICCAQFDASARLRACPRAVSGFRPMAVRPRIRPACYGRPALRWRYSLPGFASPQSDDPTNETAPSSAWHVPALAPHRRCGAAAVVAATHPDGSGADGRSAAVVERRAGEEGDPRLRAGHHRQGESAPTCRPRSASPPSTRTARCGSSTRCTRR